jgi:hypothetical protein
MISAIMISISVKPRPARRWRPLVIHLAAMLSPDLRDANGDPRLSQIVVGRPWSEPLPSA